MLRRRRTLVGLVALISLILSSGQSVWAATCAPMESMSGPDMGMMDMPAPMPADHEHETLPGQAEGDDCPLMPFGAVQSCTAIASPPPAAPRMMGPAPVLEEAALGGESIVNRYEPSLLYRPPRS